MKFQYSYVAGKNKTSDELYKFLRWKPAKEIFTNKFIKSSSLKSVKESINCLLFETLRIIGFNPATIWLIMTIILLFVQIIIYPISKGSNIFISEIHNEQKFKNKNAFLKSVNHSNSNLKQTISLLWF